MKSHVPINISPKNHHHHHHHMYQLLNMASSLNGNFATTADAMVRRAEIEAVQTVPPSKITVPRAVRQVSSLSQVGPCVWGGCLHIVLYYNKLASGEDSGSIHAGWIKDSLAGVLSEQPLLAGRLLKGQKIGSKEEEDINLIVANDAGTRLVEARIPATMADFMVDLDSAKNNSSSTKKEAEARLVFWKDVDEKDPQFCPLFYVQVCINYN